MNIENLVNARFSQTGEVFSVDKETGIVYQRLPETEEAGSRLTPVSQAERCPGCGRFVCNGLCTA